MYRGRRFNVLDAVSYAQKLAESEDFSFTLRCESCNQVLTPEHSGREHVYLF